MSRQAASNVILIRPVGFGYDPETAASNPFQHRTSDPEVKAKAELEFDGLISALDHCGVGRRGRRRRDEDRSNDQGHVPWSE